MTLSNINNNPLFTTHYRIYINHTDAGGIVYHANHLVFFENCRRDWFTQIGLNGYFLQGDNGQVQHFVVSQADLKYRKAIFLDEIINVHIDKVELRPASIIFYQSIHRQMDDSPEFNDSLLSSTKIVIACVQNQIQSEKDLSTPSSDVPTAMANASPIKPIRVPQKLHNIIKKAITQPANQA